MSKKINILLVCSPYYKLISENLIKGASEILNEKSINYDVLFVPGALEIPPAIKLVSSNLNKSNFFDGYIALGCVIRGETYHFEIVATESARSLSNLSVLSSLPIGNGILTVENMEQAILRSDPKKLNKGAGAALACLSLIEIKNNLWVE
ncbi:MAG: 6,7-dimethyl-8-ribityllumazine synthase [Proteobacteria bacterium]|jgi:6,7-dimethyl-8-ribityllumazine synthase|nr:6,7-dimethyl-8-ribityllumazine synthase [Pseudomonadota bacterium]MDA1136316.1 6,7-dimethyl-8-ribityllumazine synthase [Pseudomonadota bacterium]